MEAAHSSKTLVPVLTTMWC